MVFTEQENEATETLQDSADDGTTALQDGITSTHEAHGPSGSFKTFQQLADTSKIYERLPMLEVVLDRFSRRLVTTLRNFIRSNVEIDILSISSIRFGQFMEALPALSMMGIFKIAGTHPAAMITVEKECIGSVVDYLLGGRKTPFLERPESKGYTAIEMELIKKLLNLTLADLEATFSLVHATSFELDVVETNPAFAFFISARDAAITVRFKVTIDSREGFITLLIPYETLEPFREKLLQTHTSENEHRGTKWKHHLEDELKQATLSLRVELDHYQSHLNDVLQWKIGSIIPLNVGSDVLVKLFCGNRVVLSGHIGQKNKNMAIKIEENLLGDASDILPFIEEN